MVKSIPGKVIWLTGLPCSGKTTVARACAERFAELEIPVEHLDGDEVRDRIQFASFSRESRELHLRYIAFMASRLASHGVNVLCSFISPRQEHRDFARSLCDEFLEVYLATSLETCEKRDVKGHYAKARKGEISNFTGIDGVYEKPTNPNVVLDTEKLSVEDCVDRILNDGFGLSAE